jgi:hypothetical protein
MHPQSEPPPPIPHPPPTHTHTHTQPTIQQVQYFLILLNETSIWFLDECGFKIEGVSTSDENVWILRMSNNDANNWFAEFTITVISK